MKAPLAYGIILLALCAFLFLASPRANQRESSRGVRKHGPRLKLRKDPGNYNVELEHIPFDPVIAEFEQKREDALWEKTHEWEEKHESERQWNELKAAAIGFPHPASGIDDFLDHHLDPAPGFDPDYDNSYENDYLDYLEEGFNFTARIEALFPMIDRDRNGMVTLEEMWAWHQELAKNQSMHRSDREMSVLVHGKEGKVTLQDYLHDPNEGSEGARVWPEHNLKWVRDSRRKFPLADADGDGKLDRFEFDDFLHPEDSENERLKRYVREEEIRERDTDGDGKLSFDEFLSGLYEELRDLRAEEEEDARLILPEHRPEGPGSDIDDRSRSRPTGKQRQAYVREQSAIANRRWQRARQKFEELDRDRDEFLGEHELVPVIDKLNPGESYFARVQAESLLNLADDNNDGQLSIGEMLAHKHSFYRTIDEDDEIFIHDEF